MQIKERKVAGTRAYQIDNFYSHPEWILNHICSTIPQPHGVKDSKSNGVEYADVRHTKALPELRYYHEIIENLVGGIKYNNFGRKGVIDDKPLLKTNFMQWRDTEFNDYKNCYWWPHYDNCWSCIIYLNHDASNGTNIYRDKDDYFRKVQTKNEEHHKPWHPKENYDLIDYLEPVFNRAYVFQAGKLMHGAAVNDETYFEKNGLFRLNQVMFFDEES